MLPALFFLYFHVSYNMLTQPKSILKNTTSHTDFLNIFMEQFDLLYNFEASLSFLIKIIQIIFWNLIKNTLFYLSPSPVKY